MSNGDRGAAGLTNGRVATQSLNAVASGSGKRAEMKAETFVSFSPTDCIHWVNKPTWMAWRDNGLLSCRAAFIRAEDAWLNAMDIAPPHLLDWKPDHAVRIAVTESSTTAMISCSSVARCRSGGRSSAAASGSFA